METAPTDWRVCPPVELTPLLRHAAEAFFDQGFHGTSVRDIAGRVGVTVPALYYHHENKEAILLAVLRSSMVDLLPRGEAAIADGHGDPVLELANLVQSNVLHLARRARFVALDSETRYLSPQARNEYIELRRAVERLTRKVVQRGVDRGVFHAVDVAVSTRAILGMLQAIPRWYKDTGEMSPSQLAQRYAELSLALLGIPPEECARVSASAS
ncbi:TetR/AcrR family transcriptional regulator [Nocardioides sp. SR21]|uniref:TetR/AcrR family transcriptional regulator n=1 Tax=Nocardioides sp. SR21 TaxID=2919501 RepID=UPI001FAAF7E6|nr:TetR/AcrR family transcriptional regulator [Nocardioides sp. SR21]